ncbi:universal stress protein [Pseudarthrobacter chlorophenolicus]|uniref:universal stress protein n=1 Tax=Pseudarthrobacter chlorophenolicus TaxID=85085 RepID=UPI0009E23D2C|nr:universal stress protein [Pseudarthrobacter chlorophenolicus]
MESTSIVVGYDGSGPAALAVRWAAREAALRRVPLHLVHCTLWPLLTKNLGPVPGIADSGLQRAAEITLEEGVGHAKQASPGVDVRTSLVSGSPAVQLPKIAADQELLVVGSRGLGGFMGLLVGSVSLELAATAPCPVAVIREGGDPGGPVLVAVDDLSSPALEDACSAAAAEGTRLVIAHVQTVPSGYRLVRDPVDPGAAAEALLDAAVANARELAPELTVEKQLLTDTSVPRAVLHAAEAARLTVVGTKGQGVIKGSIGSTAHAILHHAKGPVLVSRRQPAAKGAHEA